MSLTGLLMKVMNVCPAMILLFESINISHYLLSVFHTDTAEPLSYNACLEFANHFNRLYNLRDTEAYPHPNPMLRSPNAVLDDSSTGAFFDSIQFPLAYNFPMDESGLVDRTFEQEAFNGGTDSALFNRKFALVDPVKNTAIRVPDCEGRHPIMSNYDNTVAHQHFRLTENDQLESIGCSGKVISVGVVKTTWMCKSGGVEKGTVTITGENDGDAVAECTESKDGCINHSCTVTRQNNDYCIDGNVLILEDSNSDDMSQKWRFYENGIVNLACGRMNGNLAISQINDDNFDQISLFEELQFSFVNPSNNKAITVGGEVRMK